MPQSKTILYIDDDADDREILSVQLRRIDNTLTIAEAVNGAEGLQYLSQAKSAEKLPCLIVLDLNMPVLDGRQTFNRIKSDHELAKIPIVVYTSSINPNDSAYFRKQGVELINKPLSTRVMPEIASSMLSFCRIRPVD
jgi:CheY-like chemotaxis protein